MKTDRGTKNNNDLRKFKFTIVSATISAGATWLISLLVLVLLPFSGKFAFIWPASGIALASLINSKGRLFLYTAITQLAAMILARAMLGNDLVATSLTSALEISNAVAIALVLRNLSVNKYIFTRVSKMVTYLLVTLLITLFTGLFSMFLAPLRWPGQVSIEWTLWVLAILPSVWIISPLLLSYFRRFERVQTNGRIEKQVTTVSLREPIIVGAVTLAGIVALFNVNYTYNTGMILIVIGLPILMFSAIRFDSLSFMIILALVGEAVSTHAYLSPRYAEVIRPLDFTDLFLIKVFFLIFSAALMLISVLVRRYEEGKGFVFRTREEFAANFMDSHLGMFHTDNEGEILRVNRTLIDLLGYDSEEQLYAVLEKDPTALYFAPADKTKYLSLVAEDHGWVDAPITLKARTGRPISVEIAGRPWKEQNYKRFIEVIVTDLSKVMITNQRLKNIEDRVRHATQIGGIGIWEMVPIENTFTCNPVLRGWLGEETGDADIDLSNLRARVDPAYFNVMDQTLSNVRQGLIEIFSIDLRVRVDGIGWRHLNFTGKRVNPEGANQLPRWIGTTTDNTKETERNQTLIRENEKLRDQLAENDKLRDLAALTAVRDHVTSLYTRNYMKEIFGKAKTDADHNGHNIHLILLDLPAGGALLSNFRYDQVQQIINIFADITRHNFRVNDHIGRFKTYTIGVLTDINNEDAIRTRLNKIISQFDAAMLNNFSQIVPIHSSVVCYPDDGVEWDEVWQKAETTLYKH